MINKPYLSGEIPDSALIKIRKILYFADIQKIQQWLRFVDEVRIAVILLDDAPVLLRPALIRDSTSHIRRLKS